MDDKKIIDALNKADVALTQAETMSKPAKDAVITAGKLGAFGADGVAIANGLDLAEKLGLFSRLKNWIKSFWS